MTHANWHKHKIPACFVENAVGKAAAVPWDEDLFALFDDLESRAQELYDREREAELADRERSEYAEVTLAGRLMASLEAELTVTVVGLGPVRGRLERVARGWFLLRAPGQDWVVCTEAVTSVEGAGPRAVPDIAWPVGSRVGLGSALRRLADAGERCVLVRRDGTRADGVVRRVGKDFVELLTGDPQRIVLVGTEALAAVLSTR